MTILGLVPCLPEPQDVAGGADPLADAYLWLDFTDSTSLENSATNEPSNGEEIYVAYDQTTNSRDFSRNVAGPDFTTGGRNSQSFADFVSGSTSGTAEQLKSDNTYTTTDATHTAIFILEQLDNPPHNGFSYLAFYDFGNSNDYSGTGEGTWRISSNSAGHSLLTRYDYSDNTAFYIAIYRIDDTNDRVWINVFDPAVGYTWAFTRTLTSSKAWLNTDNFWLSGDASRNNGYLGRMYEYAFYDSLLSNSTLDTFLTDRATKYSYTFKSIEPSLENFDPLHWWDFTDSSNYTLSDGDTKYSGVTNKGSGSGNLDQSTSNNRPTYTASEQTGSTSATFSCATFDDGTYDQWMDCSYGATYSSHHTLICVFKTPATLADSHIFAGYDGSGTADSDLSHGLAISSTTLVQWYRQGQTTNLTTSLATDTFYIYIARVSSDTGQSDDTALSVADATTSEWAPALNPATWDLVNMTVGGKSGGASNFNGKIFELAILDRGVSQREINELGATLAAKYDRQWNRVNFY